MKTTKNRSNSKKNRAKFLQRKTDVSIPKSLRCYEESDGRQILRQLSKKFPLEVKIWKSNHLVKKFRSSDPKSKQVDVEFFPATPRNQGYWSLKGGKAKGCLLNLMAIETKTSLDLLKDVIRYPSGYHGPSSYFPKTTLEPYAKGWIDNSQGKVAYVRNEFQHPSFKYAYPRKHAADLGQLYRYQFNGSVQKYSQRQPGPIYAFQSREQQEHLLYLADINILAYDRKLLEFLDDKYKLDYEFFIMKIADLNVPEYLMPVMGGIWEDGMLLREFQIDSVALVLSFENLKHTDPRNLESLYLLIHEFRPWVELEE